MTKWQTKEQTKAWRTFLQHFSAGMGGKGRIYYIGGTDVLPRPLTPKEEEHLISCMGTVGEKEAKSRLIEHNLRLVVYIAKKFENTGVGVEDLISIGTIGLIKGINTFNKTKKIKLATYASRCIENEILMYLRRNSKRKTEVSIDEPLNVDWDGNELLLSDILGTDEDMVYRDMEEEAERRQLSNALSKLPSRERRLHHRPVRRGGDRHRYSLLFERFQICRNARLRQNLIPVCRKHNRVHVRHNRIGGIRQTVPFLHIHSSVPHAHGKKHISEPFFRFDSPVPQILLADVNPHLHGV